MDQFGKFCYSGPRSTPPMTVTVTRQGKEIKTYRTPGGFRLEQYVSSKYPDLTVFVTFPKNELGQRPDFKVVVFDENKEEVEVHYGVFDRTELD